MQTTGSRLRLQMPPGVLRLLVGAMIVFAVMAFLAGTHSAFTGKAHAGVVAKITVNSTGNSDDGDCEGPPNDGTIGGDCTLIEAINDANAGLADLINFQPSIFPVVNPGVINIDACLPPITRSGITIDTENSGVILDGDADFDNAPNQASPITCEAAIDVEPGENGFNFAILGGKNLTIRNFDADGIRIEGDDTCAPLGGGCGLGNVTIDGVKIEKITGDGITVQDVREARNLVITHNDIVASYSTPLCSDPGPCVTPARVLAVRGVDIEVQRCFSPAPNHCVFDHDQSIMVNDNQQIIGDHEAVRVRTQGDIGNPVTGAVATVSVQVNGNGFLNAIGVWDGHGVRDLTNAADNGVRIRQDGCIAKSAYIAQVNGNTRIDTVGDDAVDIDVNGGENTIGTNDTQDPDGGACYVLGHQASVSPGHSDDGPFGSDFAHVTVNVNDNGNIRTQGTDPGLGEGISIETNLCCGDSQNVNTVTIDGNGNIIGDNNGILFDAQICCGSDNISTLDISANGEITGRNDEGIDVDMNYVGETRALDGADSDGNTATTTIENNDRITGVDDDGIYVDNEAGVILGNGGSSDNTSTVTINGNRRIDGERAGLDVFSWALGCLGSADSNSANITVNDNEQISGSNGDGAYLDAEAGSLSFFDYSFCTSPKTAKEGDDNVTTILVQGNDRFVGNSGSGIYTFSFAGGNTKASERNANNTTVTQNGSIEGEGTERSDDGIHVQDFVCCSSRKSNFDNTTITSNAKIIGHDGDGIDMDGLCCSTAHYVTVISDNGRIVGGGDNGIEYTVAVGGDAANSNNDTSGNCSNDNNGDPTSCPDIGLSEDLKQDGFYNTMNDLTISHNLIEDSNADGIYICCGPFESAEQSVKSMINDNIVTTNLDHGIEIDSSFGLNIVHNEIFKNGDDSALDAGIEIDNQCSEGFTHGRDQQCMADNGSACCLNVVPANHNRISDNSIYDNRGLGIDLVADRGLDGDTEIDHGVGCKPKSTPTNPNDCLPAPSFKTQAGNKLVGHACSTCIVEIFAADDDPSDNSPSNPHHGEGVGSDVFADHSHYYLATGPADADGNFSVNLPCGLGAMDLTATAIDKDKNTSEFSLNTSTLGTSSCAPPTNTVTNTPVPTTPAPTAVPTTPAPPTNTPVPPTATHTPVPTAAGKACGDVDDNGHVNAIDALLVLQYKAGLIATLPNLPSADTDNSGEVTSVDAALILQAEAVIIPQSSLHCPA